MEMAEVKINHELLQVSKKCYRYITKSDKRNEEVLVYAGFNNLWTINEFEFVEEDMFLSNRFGLIDDKPYRLELDFKTEKGQEQCHFSLRAQETCCDTCNYQVLLELSIVDAKGSFRNIKQVLLKDKYYFNHKFENYFNKKYIFDESNNLIKDGSLKLSFQIQYYSQLYKIDLNKVSKYQLDCDWEQLFTQQKYADLTINTQDGQVHAHKCILLNRSKYFATMFGYDCIEARTNTIEIVDFTTNIITEMLRFIYCGRINNMDSIIIDLYRAANKYQIQDMENHLEKFLIDSISIENIKDILYIIEKYNPNELKKFTFDYIHENMKELKSTVQFNDGLKNLSSDTIRELFCNVIDRNYV